MKLIRLILLIQGFLGLHKAYARLVKGLYKACPRLIEGFYKWGLFLGLSGYMELF